MRTHARGGRTLWAKAGLDAHTVRQNKNLTLKIFSKLKKAKKFKAFCLYPVKNDTRKIFYLEKVRKNKKLRFRKIRNRSITLFAQKRYII